MKKQSTLLLLLCIFCITSFANVTLPRLISNGMVLQRGVNLTIWGWASVGENVTVNINGNNYAATTGSDGKWSVILPAVTGGNTAYTMTITGNNTLSVTNIVFGDVFLCSGQSNMAHIVNTSASLYAAEIASSTNNYIRHFKVTRKYSATALDDVQSTDGWEMTTPTTVKDFTAVGYFFARDLYAKYGIPIGLLNSSYEGTPAQAWMSQDGLTAFPNYTSFTVNNTNPEYNPSYCYNAMINPLLNYKFKSIVWYQGESNRLRSYEYRTLFPALIVNFRNKLNQGTLPFLFVQLHNYLAVATSPEEANTAECREAQAMALAQPVTAMATAIDTNSDTITHPLEKKPVGERLSLAAQNMVYGESTVVYQGPTYQSYTISGNKVIITFSNIGGGLVAQNGALKQFAIAGADRRFRYATATIVGNTIELTNDTIQKPVAARYAWAYNPMGANLYNAQGLPAYPFRTDQWAGLTYIAPTVATSLSASYIPGNLAVLRYGDGNAALSTATVPMFIDEYTATASSGAVSNLAMPTATSGSNYRLVGVAKTAATTFNVENMPSLSQDGSALAIYGHDQVTGSFSTGSSEKVVALVDASGTINSSTKTNTNLGTSRAAVADGSNVWFTGYQNGVRKTTVGSDAATYTSITTNPGASRSMQVYRNKLYLAIGSNNFYAFNNLPSAAAAATASTLTGTVGNNQMALFDTDNNGNPDVIYVADDGGSSTPQNAALRKYVLVGSTWTAKGSITVTDSSVLYGLKGITGRITGNTVELYAVTWGNLNTGATAPSQLLSFKDVGFTTSTISLANSSPEVIATADNNTMFRGVTFTPGTTVNTTLPVVYKSFSGYRQDEKVFLKWSASVEVNNDYYEVQRSADGTNFKAIGKVQSNALYNYSFTDATPLKGDNYYRLAQTDKDGSKTLSNILRIRFSDNRNEVKVIATSQNNITLSVVSNKQENAAVHVFDGGGKAVYSGTISLQNGRSIINLPVATAAAGVYIIKIAVSEGVMASKFIAK